jgi:hypothetical protein
MPIHKVLLFALLGWVLTAAGLAAEPAAAAEQAAAAEPVAEAEQAAQAEGESQAEELPVLEDIETILTQPLDQAEYVESQRCLSRYKFDRVEFLDNEHVLFIGRGGKAWLNTLRAPCVGLRRRDIPRFEYRGANQLCNLDTFVGLDSNFSGFSRSSASCALGSFQPVTQEQVALLKATVESRKGGNRTKKKKDPGES